MAEITISDLARTLPDTIRRVREDGERVTVTKHGLPVARIVPHEQGGHVVARVEGAPAKRPKIEAGR